MKEELEQKFDEKFSTFIVELFHYDTGGSAAPLIGKIKQFIDKHFISFANLEEYLEKRIVDEKSGGATNTNFNRQRVCEEMIEDIKKKNF